MVLVTRVAPPARKPRSGGIKDIVGSFILEERLTATEKVAWEDSGCGLPELTQAGCFDTTFELVEGEVPDKTASGISVVDGIAPPFAQYAGVECYLGGDNDGPTYSEQAERLLEQGEDRRIEQVLWDWALATGTTALTDAADIVAAIGAVEEYADENYVGQPVIILSRATAVAAFAAGAIERDSGRLVTANGNPVLATGAVPDDEQGEVAAVGWPAVYASQMRSYIAPNLRLNRSLGLAERAYAIGVDCAFRVTVGITTP